MEKFSRIVILGHSGFVGNWLYSYFSEKFPHTPIVGLSSQEADLLSNEYQKLGEYFDETTAVVMTAGIKSTLGNTIETFGQNMTMIENVCKVLQNHPVKKFLYFSSISVYGVDNNNPKIRETDPINPMHFYDLAKAASEKLLEVTCSKIPTKLILFRPPTMYGPGEKVRAHIPSGFLETYLKGGEVTLWGDGSELREFIFIKDVCRAVDLLLQSDFSGPINFGNGKGDSYKDALDAVSKVLRRDLTIHSKPRSKPQIDKIFDNSKFMSLFPNFTFTPLEVGLQFMLDTIQTPCQACNSPVTTKINLPNIPVSNRFSSTPNKETLFDIGFGFCESCGLAQLTKKVPQEELVPKLDWITYVEPEEHLDALATRISNLPGLSATSKILGMSFKDTSLIERLQKKGWNLATTLSPSQLNLPPHAGVEQIQAKLTRDNLKNIPKQDVIVFRHILEHSYNLKEVLQALKSITKDKGYIVIEVPDCAQAFSNSDYMTLWEEHIEYFTPTSFQNTLHSAGLSTVFFENYPYPLENSLIAITQKGGPRPSPIPFDKDLTQINNFILNFLPTKRKIQDLLSSWDLEKIAILGAGHLTVGFISFFEIQQYIDLIIDDNPQKNGLFLPGGHLPIRGSDELKNIDICLLGLNPRNEHKVISKHEDFLHRGGQFFSIFSKSTLALPPIQTNKSLKCINQEVFINNQPIVSLNSDHIEFIKHKARTSPKKRARICTHQHSDSVHEMIICLTHDGYIRPHKHKNKTESFHLIEGEIDILIFDNEGNLTDIVELSKTTNTFYRLNTDLFHTVVIKSPLAVFHETTNGPFDRKDTIEAHWAPPESRVEEGKKFIENLQWPAKLQ